MVWNSVSGVGPNGMPIPISHEIVNTWKAERDWHVAQIMEINGKASFGVAALVVTLIFGLDDLQNATKRTDWTDGFLLASVVLMFVGCLLAVSALVVHASFHSKRVRLCDAVIEGYLTSGVVGTVPLALRGYRGSMSPKSAFEGLPENTWTGFFPFTFIALVLLSLGAIGVTVRVIQSWQPPDAAANPPRQSAPPAPQGP